MDKYRDNFGNGGEFVDNNDYSKEIAGEFEGRAEEEIVVEAKKEMLEHKNMLFLNMKALLKQNLNHIS